MKTTLLLPTIKHIHPFVTQNNLKPNREIVPCNKISTTKKIHRKNILVRSVPTDKKVLIYKAF